MIATLHIQTARRENSTYLKNTYCTVPFKIANITEDKKANQLHLMLMSSSPGILDGDQYQLKIELEEGCSLQLHTQSYQRLFNMKQRASQLLELHLSAHSSFCFLPHPSVPHAQSVFKCINKIYLEDNCSLVFGEILTCGRKLNGEVFLFSKYHSITEVFLNNKLIIKENLLIEPATINLNAIGQLEGFTHQASLIYLHPTAAIKLLNEAVNDYLLKQTGIVFGITGAPANGLIIRILGQKAEQLHSCLKTIATLLPQNLHLKPFANAV
ncbi:MAG: urease accessory protein UreD [Ferruginibacter sp.]|nr:urease accessory protein UreD [Ferruginibacter sp.]